MRRQHDATSVDDRSSIELPRRLGDDPWELVLDLPGGRIVGGSVAALATAFAVEPLGVAIDLGRCSARLAAQSTALLTHCHADHLAGLIAWLAARSRQPRGTPCRVVVPAARRDALLGALNLWPDFDRVRRRLDLESTVAGARGGERIELPEGGWAKAFSAHHGVPTLGWQVGLAGEDRPLAVFAGDGTVLPFRDRPELLDAAAAVVECTFVEPKTRVAARLGGHSHLEDWLELAPSLTCDRLVLAHLPPDASSVALAGRFARSAERHGGPRWVAWLAR